MPELLTWIIATIGKAIGSNIARGSSDLFMDDIIARAMHRDVQVPREDRMSEVARAVIS